MGIITTEVEVRVSGKEQNYYTLKGYIIPKYKDKKGRIKVKLGISIMVKVEDLPKSSNAKIEYECDSCHKINNTIWSSYIKSKHGELKYCHQCSSKIFLSGENNYGWNYSKTEQERIIRRNYPQYKEFVKKVLLRDNFLCQHCGNIKNTKLEVHHLNGYNWDKNGRLRESNAVTLCVNCHKNFHSIYGRGDNTKQQFLEWNKNKLELNNAKSSLYVLPITRKAYCIEDNEIIDSIKLYCKRNNIAETIYECCNHNRYTYKDKHYLWYDEYIKMSKEELEKFLIDSYTALNKFNIICLEEKLIFNSKQDCCAYYHISLSSLNKQIENTSNLLYKKDNICLHWIDLKNFIERFGIKKLNKLNKINTIDCKNSKVKVDRFYLHYPNQLQVNNKIPKMIKQFDKNGNLIKIWNNSQEIKNFYKISDMSAIYKVCNGKLHYTENYVWRFKEDSFDKYPVKRKDSKTVYQYDLQMNLIKKWESTMEVERSLGYKNYEISSCCNKKRKNFNGYIWSYNIIE